MISEAEAQRRRNFSMAGLKHGQHKTPEYTAWLSMRQRCVNTKHPCYAGYGGRGITVCERWDLFENFISDMGKRPSPRHEIERLNNDKGYYPDNCAWKTRFEQMRNTRKTRLVTLGDVTQCLKDWCRDLGISYKLTLNRISKNWSLEKAMFTPVDTKFRNGRAKGKSL